MLRGRKKRFSVVDADGMAFLKHDRFVIWDIETDIAQRVIWLVGAHDTATGERVQFFDPEDEAACLRWFMEWMALRPEAVPLSYSGSGFDPTVLGRSLARHGIEDATGVVRRDVDLADKLQYQCVGSFGGRFALKELAATMGYKFRHPEIDGEHVGMMFTRFLETREPPDWTYYLEYNDDDVGATLHVFDRR